MNIKFFSVVVIILSFGVGVSAGDIQGKIRVFGVKDSRDAVLYIEELPKEKLPPLAKEEVVMDQKGLTFIPHVLPLRAGTTVQFLNSDDVRHNIFTPSAVGDKFNLGTYPKGETRKKVFNKVGEVVCLCNVHPEMSAYIVVLQNPYFAVSDKEGNYRITNVPAGKYRLKSWHEKTKKRPEKEVVVPAEGSLKIDLELRR